MVVGLNQNILITQDPPMPCSVSVYLKRRWYVLTDNSLLQQTKYMVTFNNLILAKEKYLYTLFIEQCSITNKYVITNREFMKEALN